MWQNPRKINLSSLVKREKEKRKEQIPLKSHNPEPYPPYFFLVGNIVFKIEPDQEPM